MLQLRQVFLKEKLLQGGKSDHCKPDSVLSLKESGCHLSVRAEPGTRNAGKLRLVPYLLLLREEFTYAAYLSAIPGGLLPRLFTLTLSKQGGLFLLHWSFCGI